MEEKNFEIKEVKLRAKREEIFFEKEEVKFGTEEYC